jgi:hypothetical protein
VAKFSKRTRHRKGRLSRPLAERRTHEVATRPAARVGAPSLKREARGRWDYLNGSFTTTFTPLIVPVTTSRTLFTAVALISSAP